MNTEEQRDLMSKLQAMHPDAQCELQFGTVFQLLVSVILSAQCTDKRVNEVTAKLFPVYGTAQEFAALDPTELEPYIFSCGFYHNKAKNVVLAARAIVETYGGDVPEDFDALCSLPGVGRKTANVVTSVAFGRPAIAVDTHVFRVANRIGLADASTPEKTEQALREAFAPENWSKLHHLLIFQGRYVCHSRNPECERCLLRDECKHYGKQK